jgi:hypothetical protein
MGFTLPSNALFTDAQLQAWTGVDPDDPDADAVEVAKIEMAAAAASTLCENYCGRSFNLQSYTQVIDSQAADELILSIFPVRTITSIKYDDETIDADKYYFDDSDSNVGIVVFKNYVIFPKGRAKFEVQYTAGYSTVPSDVSYAALLQTSYLTSHYGGSNPMLGYRELGKMNERIVRDEGISNDGLDGNVRGILERYRILEAPGLVMTRRTM